MKDKCHYQRRCSSIAIMANQMNPDAFRSDRLIDPSDIHQMKMETNRLQMAIKNILFAPLVGTALYNFYVSEDRIRSIFDKKVSEPPTTGQQEIYRSVLSVCTHP